MTLCMHFKGALSGNMVGDNLEGHGGDIQHGDSVCMGHAAFCTAMWLVAVLLIPWALMPLSCMLRSDVHQCG